ncbi:Protein PIN-LIKES 3 [Glycine max]|nr:Protein PIN-LIKES 3 [Glycine max]
MNAYSHCQRFGVMGFIQLLSVASFPVIKVLLVTAIGLFLALDDISILGEDSRKKVNQLVFYVFNPSLVGSNLAKTITFESIVQLWFMPLNILCTFILGSALGWILIKMTRPPKHMEGLILGCCSAGNLGNLLIVIIPAICKESGNPFGDSDVCYQYGMAYAALSMAIGAVFIWSYVYNIMRISSSRIQKEDNTGNGINILKASAEASESRTDNFSETLNPTKDATDDAYTLLLPHAKPEEKVSISRKIKHHLGVISSNLNFKAMFAPSTLGAIAGFIIGVISPMRNFIIGSSAPLHVVEESVFMLGDAAVPTLTLIMGANLLKGLKGSTTPVWTVVGIVAVRYIFLPLLGVAVVKGAIHFSLVHSDALYQFVLLLQYALPPAMNIGTIAQLFGAGESECSVIMLWTYILAAVAVTLWSTFFMWLVL